MATRAELRSTVRERLVDTTGDPLWSDAALHTAITAALRAYSLRVPRQATATVPISAGATSVAVPGLVGPGGVVRVVDPRGRVVPPATSDPAGGGAAQTWRWWADSLQLARPALGGDWRLEYLAPRPVPATDDAVLVIEPGDEELVVALTLAAALRTRATDEAKRGRRAELAAAAEAARAEVARLFTARGRRVRGGWLGAPLS